MMGQEPLMGLFQNHAKNRPRMSPPERRGASRSLADAKLPCHIRRRTLAKPALFDQVQCLLRLGSCV